MKQHDETQQPAVVNVPQADLDKLRRLGLLGTCTIEATNHNVIQCRALLPGTTQPCKDCFFNAPHFRRRLPAGDVCLLFHACSSRFRPDHCSVFFQLCE